ncbi:MAG: hypothetical protein ABI867_33530 [Kofleriaceae bacterium]
MRLGFVCSLLFSLVVGCGGTSSGDDDDGPTPGDTDGDGISDVDEGIDTNADTDGDGTPDFQDEDSDGDGIPDYREAGDIDLATGPIDSDGDGLPDFRDLDSDANGRSDSMDGVEDRDGDGKGDYADVDDDGDQINDIDELGPEPLQPTDTDNDGTPDFHDLDSDNDTINDIFEGVTDFDSDGTANFRDLDSDDDCISDQLESGGVTPPINSDADQRPNFIDRDSDDDGVLDSAEDANCNGSADPGESSATNADTDGDGVTDLVETVAGTDPTNPADNPQANGDFVFVEPFMDVQAPLDDDLDFKTNLRAVDMYVLLDRSGSMLDEIAGVRNNLGTVVNQLTCAPLGTGVPPDCIPDLWAGAGTLGYTGSGADAFRNFADLQPNPSFAGLPVTEPGGCCAEVMTFAAFASVTGQGGANFGLGGVPARATCAGSPAANAGFTPFGYPCFREGALPIVLLATDEPPFTTSNNPNWAATVVPQFTNRGARLVGILGSGIAANTDTQLRQMATDTGAIDAANGNAPLVFQGAGAAAPTAIKNGILTLANGLPLDINALTNDDPADAVNAVTSFVDHIETLQLGTAACANGLNDIDTNADTFDDKYLAVRTGTPVCWKLFSKQNTTVPATDQPQLFRATVVVFGDGITELDRRDVFFLVPPKPADGPIQ